MEQQRHGSGNGSAAQPQRNSGYAHLAATQQVPRGRYFFGDGADGLSDSSPPV
jgi:hypothetical protein